MDQGVSTPLPAQTRYWRFLEYCTGADGKARLIHSQKVSLHSSASSNSDPKWLLKYADSWPCPSNLCRLVLTVFKGQENGQARHWAGHNPVNFPISLYHSSHLWITDFYSRDREPEIEGFPMKLWNIEIFLLDDAGNPCDSSIIAKAVYNLHPSFANPVQSTYP